MGNIFPKLVVRGLAGNGPSLFQLSLTKYDLYQGACIVSSGSVYLGSEIEGDIIRKIYLNTPARARPSPGAI